MPTLCFTLAAALGAAAPLIKTEKGMKDVLYLKHHILVLAGKVVSWKLDYFNVTAPHSDAHCKSYESFVSGWCKNNIKKIIGISKAKCETYPNTHCTSHIFLKQSALPFSEIHFVP